MLPDEPRAPESISLASLIKRPQFAVPGIVLILAIAALAVWWQMHRVKVGWAKDVALPEIERLTEHIPWSGEGPETWQAFELAIEAERYIPDDPLLERLWPEFSDHLKVRSDPSGASVYAKPYGDVESDWQYMGETPIDSIRFPSGISRIKLEKEGYSTVYDLLMLITWASYTRSERYRLFSLDSLPGDMEYIPGRRGIRSLVGLTHKKQGGIEPFLMDRYEVTNKEYARFVDSGGYSDKKYWKHAFSKDGRELSWEDAMRLFVDRTGRPGPSTWEVGEYPEANGNHPVSGVSWYEAAAYAEFAGKRLPTIYHWARPAAFYASAEIIPLSNMPSEGTVPVGSSQSMNRFGIYDLAGNVREWCLNRSSLGQERFILGGGWDDPEFAFPYIYAQDPFDRHKTNGFRCMRLIGSEDNFVDLGKVVELDYRDFESEPKISEETFKTFLKQYDYDKTEFDAKVEWIREEEDWIREKITFNAAYGGERVIAYLYLPKNGSPPYKTVVYFPGVSALTYFTESEEDAVPFKVVLKPDSRGFLTKSGYAVLYPIYKSTFERGDKLKSDVPDTTHFYKEHVIMWVKDLKRSIDYLETRDDIDSDRIAYFGYSWGSSMGAIVAAVEPRIKASVLFVGGLLFPRSLPEVEFANYLPHVTSPVLMLNGEYDFYFPYETTQVPFFEMLGTREEDKKLSVHKSSHLVPNTELMKETLAWLDRYLE
jgi:dienelactone hydrolase